MRTPPIVLQEPHRPRPIRFLDLWQVDGWRLKAYGIAYGGRERPDARLVDAALDLARKALPSPPVTPARYGVGFVGVHEGRGMDVVFVCWWEDENELRYRSFVSPKGEPAFEERTRDGNVICIWDLAVVGFERDAWASAVLANPKGPDVDEYLARRLNGEF